MKKINGDSYIVSIVLINIEDGSEKPLYTREDSRCHFSDEFIYKGYKIRFRLDWGDIQNGEPVLDADITFELRPKEKIFDPQHHMWKERDWEGRYIYDFEFEGLKFRFLAKKTVKHDIAANATISAPINTVLIVDENADHEPYDEVKRMLKERGGFELLTAACGEDGASLLVKEGKRPDVLLLDLLTPFERGRHLRIGEGLPEKLQELEELTADDAFDVLFPKPSPAEKFLKCLREKGLLNSTQIILVSSLEGFEDSKARILRFFLDYGIEFCVKKSFQFEESQEIVKTITKCLKIK